LVACLGQSHPYCLLLLPWSLPAGICVTHSDYNYSLAQSSHASRQTYCWTIIGLIFVLFWSILNVYFSAEITIVSHDLDWLCCECVCVCVCVCVCLCACVHLRVYNNFGAGCSVSLPSSQVAWKNIWNHGEPKG
jgi:hypothetical protein